MARSRIIGIVDFSRTMENLLLEYGEEVNKVLDKSVETVAEAAADKLRGHRKFNPDRRPTGKYAASWKAEKLQKGRVYTEWVVHNVKHYRLTHLLEKGHPIKNQYGGTKGSANAWPHIIDVEEWCQKALPDEVEWRLGK